MAVVAREWSEKRQRRFMLQLWSKNQVPELPWAVVQNWIKTAPLGWPATRAVAVAGMILNWVLGGEYSEDAREVIGQFLKRYMFGKGPESAFLRGEYAYQKDKLVLWHLRMIALAESLFSLQKVPGFANIVTELIGGEIESTFAVLEVARVLYATQTPFRFVTRTHKAEHDFDLEVTFPNGANVACEVKSRREMLGFTFERLESDLWHAVEDQLPKNQPSMLFLKVPEAWFPERTIKKISGSPEATALDLVGDRIFRKHPNIVCIEYFVAYVTGTNATGGVRGRVGIEKTNLCSQFGCSHKWRLLRRPGETGDIPNSPDWLDLLSFFT